MTSSTRSTSNLLNTFKQLGLATTTASSSSASGSTQSLSQSDFLKLLTTQLTHQDPTNPSDTNAFFDQMAQFSMVSGMQNLLSSFQTLSSSITSDQALQAGALVGQTVSAPGSEAALSAGGSINGDFTLSSAASDVTVSIKDPSSGSVIRQIDLGAQAAGNVAFSWDGKDGSGVIANPGVYKVQVNAIIGGTNTQLATNLQNKVSSVSLGSNGGSLQVNFQGIGSVPISKVQTII